MAQLKKTVTYQDLSDELDAIMDQLQREDADIDQALLNYERGMVVIKQLEDYLKTAENKVIELKAKFSNAA